MFFVYVLLQAKTFIYKAYKSTTNVIVFTVMSMIRREIFRTTGVRYLTLSLPCYLLL